MTDCSIVNIYIELYTAFVTERGNGGEEKEKGREWRGEGKRRGGGLLGNGMGEVKKGGGTKNVKTLEILLFYVLCFVQGTGRRKKRGRGGDGKGR